MASSEEDGTNGGASEAGEEKEATGKRRRLGLLATVWLTSYNIILPDFLSHLIGTYIPAFPSVCAEEEWKCPEEKHKPPSSSVDLVDHVHRIQSVVPLWGIFKTICPFYEYSLIKKLKPYNNVIIHKPMWLVLAIAMVRFYMEKGTHKGLYKSIQKTLKFFQTFALLEIVHCLIGIVPTSVIVAGVQVSSRIFMVWLITHSIKPIQNEESVVLFLVVWTVTEITRYSFYTFSLLDHLPYFIKWARYNFFIILYPVGVVGELLTIYAALPYVKKTGMFSIRLPNKYNVSFDYYYFLLITMASYIPLFPQLYFYMLRQRRKVLHGEVIVEKED
ncbi:very-long-chain (3R)-3-hydroxyacyl-CoA dehydratase 1 [Neomonachus schauinslandi]|uniref:Very-long-chain (3R)-3-hydroxyacyl-CoA dehydratase n=1 Tax=Neomonachus schauinslandi TaxID=29088 RepID=A0A8M1MDN3_NEOSC|nr:very-long-chain (3R)-3-hydroxyacyl-CoA dehydratase 1 [Neomonachus schauinslandi]